jgi:hypothetical protein
MTKRWEQERGTKLKFNHDLKTRSNKLVSQKNNQQSNNTSIDNM